MTEAFAAQKNLEYYLNLPYPVQLTQQRDDDDAYWLAEILDLPGCVSDGATPDEAIENLEDAKQLWIETQIEDGLEVPEPTQADDYSGKFLVRMPKTLHRRLSEQAKREGISLNQHVIVLLSDGGNAIEQIRPIRRSIGQLETKIDILSKAFMAMQAHPRSLLISNMGQNVVGATVVGSLSGHMVTQEVVDSGDFEPTLAGTRGLHFGLMMANQDPQIPGVSLWDRRRELGEDFVGTGSRAVIMPFRESSHE